MAGFIVVHPPDVYYDCKASPGGEQGSKQIYPGTQPNL